MVGFDHWWKGGRAKFNQTIDKARKKRKINKIWKFSFTLAPFWLPLHLSSFVKFAWEVCKNYQPQKCKQHKPGIFCLFPSMFYPMHQSCLNKHLFCKSNLELGSYAIFAPLFFLLFVFSFLSVLENSGLHMLLPLAFEFSVLFFGIFTQVQVQNQIKNVSVVSLVDLRAKCAISRQF